MLKIKRFIIFLPVIIMLSGIFVFHSSAQGISSGCARWNSIGSTSLLATYTSSMDNQTLSAGEVISATFTLPSPGLTNVDLTGIGIGNDNRTFDNGSVTLSITVPSDGNYSSVMVGNSGPPTVDVSFSCSAGGSAGTGNSSNGDFTFTDGRINNRDSAAPIVVYPYRDDTGLGFDIYSAQGELLLRVTGDDLLTLPIIDDTHQIVVRERFGEGYQITAPQYNGKTYVLEFGVPLANIGYTSWEVD